MPKRERSAKTGKFTTNRSEKFEASLNLRVTPSMKATLERLSDKNQFVRDAIAEKLKRDGIA